MPVITVRRPPDSLEIDCPAGAPLLPLLETADCLPRADCGGVGVCGLCRIRVEAGFAPPPTPRERARLTAAALARGQRLACQCEVMADMTIAVEAPASRPAWAAISDLPPADLPAGGEGLGIAVDLGSTNIRLSLLDLGCGRRLAAQRGHNPQLRHGGDVLTRLSLAHRFPADAARMAERTVRALGDGISALFAGLGAGERRRVRRVRLVGNTAVLALTAGTGAAALLDPDNWNRRLPCRPGSTTPWRRAWRLEEGVDIEVCESLGGFVGSDLTAGVIASGLMPGPAPAMLLDFGTNTEVALWDGATLWATAAAGGPAFEGSGLSCGLPAEPGAVHRLRWPAASALPETEVIGGGVPLGLCGSGLVDAVAGLRQAGIIAASGRMAAAVPREGALLCPGPPPLRLTRGDVDLLQRAKAAVAAAAQLLMTQAGIPAAALRRLAVSGIFGRHLDAGNALAIGLLPAVPGLMPEAVEDSALRGCERLLADDGAALRAGVEARVRTVNLAAEPDYEDLFADRLRLESFS